MIQLEEDNYSNEIINEHKENLDIINNSIKLILAKNLYLYFSPDKSLISLTPIIPSNNIELLFDIFNLNKLNLSKQKIESHIKSILQNNNIKIEEPIKKYNFNGIEIQRTNSDMKIIDNKFINDCIALSKINSVDCLYNIANKISTVLYGKIINFQYLNKSNTNCVTVAINIGKKNITISRPSPNSKKARLNALIKFIEKFFPEKYSMEIINNILQNMRNKEIDNKCLLQNKRKIIHEERNKEYKGYNNYIPVNEILLGDFSIVNEHLNDFKYTPMKMMEMIINTEKYRGIDFTIKYSQLNNKNYFNKIEIAIFSQKLGIKVKGYGNTKEEAENKCAFKCLTALFKNKFRTYYELHNYFENKNGKYLDIIL